MAEGERSPRQLLTIGVVGGLIGIYLANYLNSTTGTAWFSFFAGLGAVLAVFWGADAVRRVASYGLGTGVPSIGLLSLGAGQVAVLLGLAVAMNYSIHWAAPIIALILAAIIGLVSGVMARRVIKMNIAIMERSMMEIAMAASLIMLGFRYYDRWWLRVRLDHEVRGRVRVHHRRVHRRRDGNAPSV